MVKTYKGYKHRNEQNIYTESSIAFEDANEVLANVPTQLDAEMDGKFNWE